MHKADCSADGLSHARLSAVPSICNAVSVALPHETLPTPLEPSSFSSRTGLNLQSTSLTASSVSTVMYLSASSYSPAHLVPSSSLYTSLLSAHSGLKLHVVTKSKVKDGESEVHKRMIRCQDRHLTGSSKLPMVASTDSLRGFGGNLYSVLLIHTRKTLKTRQGVPEEASRLGPQRERGKEAPDTDKLLIQSSPADPLSYQPSFIPAPGNLVRNAYHDVHKPIPILAPRNPASEYIANNSSLHTSGPKGTSARLSFRRFRRYPETSCTFTMLLKRKHAPRADTASSQPTCITRDWSLILNILSLDDYGYPETNATD
jgi:hypothetical protein